MLKFAVTPIKSTRDHRILPQAALCVWYQNYSTVPADGSKIQSLPSVGRLVHQLKMPKSREASEGWPEHFAFSRDVKRRIRISVIIGQYLGLFFLLLLLQQCNWALQLVMWRPIFLHNAQRFETTTELSWNIVGYSPLEATLVTIYQVA